MPPPKFQGSNLYTPKLATRGLGVSRKRKTSSSLDDPTVAAFRTEYKGFPNAQKPPFVLLGDTFASDTYWHGTVMTGFAEDWVKLHSEGKGTFVMTEMEDSGYMEAITRLGHMHRVDPNRVLVLRAGSNYSMPRPGHTAVESVTAPYIGMHIAVEAAYLTGSTVLHALMNDWPQTRDHIPSAK